MQINCRFPRAWASLGACENSVVDVNEGSTVKDVLLAVARVEGRPLSGLILDSQSRPKVMAVVGGQHVDPDSPVSDGDDILIVIPISGGSQ